MKTISPSKISRDWQLILLFATLKLLIHLITNTNYELHRDAYLYYAQRQHLAWGYVAVRAFCSYRICVAWHINCVYSSASVSEAILFYYLNIERFWFARD